MSHVVHSLAADLTVHSLIGASTSHLVVRRGRAMLIDCHSEQLLRWLERRGLPTPELVLHTHVQPGNCREGGSLPTARILVHQELAELAADPAAYQRAAHTVWDNPADWGITMGAEKYGVAGSVTCLPPPAPLSLAGTFDDGDRLAWQDLTFEVVPLPGHGRAHVGFWLELDGARLALFSGDLLCHPACLVNLYDLECNYGGTTLPTLPAVLRQLASQAAAEPCNRPLPFFPATGPVLADGAAAATTLATAIDDYRQALTWSSGQFTPTPQPDYPKIGRYRQLHQGIYQIDNFGNCILFIDDQGRGLMVDPGPCDFESPNRIADFHRDLDLFESQCGLRTIDRVLITHVHGDHYDLVPDLKTRYPECRVAAWDLVARVVEAPWDYPYPALLPWYNLGFDHVAVDDLLLEDQPYHWHDIDIASLHLPGHCYCHAAYLLTFNGLRLACTGDTVQSRGEADTLGFIIANHSVPGDRAGHLRAYHNLLDHPIDLNLGGHGSHFSNCHDLYAESARRIEHALPYLQRLLPGGDLEAACLRPTLPRFPART